MKKWLATSLCLLLSVWAASAFAQSNPGFTYGQVPTAAQWNNAFSAKQDVLPYKPLNRGGDSMTGKLSTTASTAQSAGFSFAQGVAPSAPQNGDTWLTSLGLYVQVNGATVGPLTDNSHISVINPSFPGTINNMVIGGTTPLAGTFTNLNATSFVTTNSTVNSLLTATNLTVPGTVSFTNPLAVASGGTGSTTASGARTNLGLGTAAVQNIGTSGANVPLLNGTNTWIGVQIVPGINVYGAASSGSQTQYFSAGGNSRWAFGIDNSTESGGNTGGNWFVNSYSDAGSYLTTPISIQRSNGIVTINNGLAVGNAGITVNAGALTVNNGINLNYNGVSGQLRANNIQTAGVIRWQYGGSGTSETGGNTGTDFFINSFNDAGTYIGTPFQITRSSGNTQLTSLSVLNGANLNTLSLTTALPVTSGGTGSGTAATAFANLGGTAVGKAASTMSGTWTPSLTFGGGSTGLTTSVLSGTYTRIGNLVFYQARITLTAVGSSTGTAVISGLPFTNGPAYSISNVYAANFVGGSAPLQGLISGSSSAINVYTANGASGTGSVALTNANFTNTSSMVVQGILDLNTLN